MSSITIENGTILFDTVLLQLFVPVIGDDVALVSDTTPTSTAVLHVMKMVSTSTLLPPRPGGNHTARLAPSSLPDGQEIVI